MVARVSRLAGAAVMLVVLASCDAVCGASPQTQGGQSAGCVDATAPHHAYVVVVHSSGAWIERCVGFAAGYIDGPTLMNNAGIRYETDHSVVCAVNGEPATTTTTCVQQSGMRWVLFIARDNRWSMTAGTLDTIRLADGQSMGWRYVTRSDASPAPPPMPHRLQS